MVDCRDSSVQRVSPAKHNRIKYLHVYIGPASLCPCPNIDSQLLAITGDQGEWVLPLIEQRSHADRRGKENTRIKNNIIGKSGTTKTWYSFSEAYLNGIYPERSIQWCNSAITIETRTTSLVEAERLDVLIKKSGYRARNIILSIAQGNPILTLKRAQKILRDCAAIDLSLHPLAKLWEQSLEPYLKEEGFKTTPQTPYFWTNDDHNNDNLSPYLNPSLSLQFISKTIQNLVSKVDITKQDNEGDLNNLDLLRNIITGGLRANIDEFHGINHISGWVDSYDFGTEISEINVIWREKNQSIGRGLVNIDRPDLTKIGINNTKCGFSIQIRPFESIPLGHRADTPISLDFVESKSGKRIGNKSWNLKQTFRGQIDGFDESLSLRGWVDSSDYGAETSKIDVIWKEQNQSIGCGLINIDRPDLAQIGIKNTLCGFSININLFKTFPKASLLDSQITLDFLESKTGNPIGGESWELTESIKSDLIVKLITDSTHHSCFKAVEDYLTQSTNPNSLFVARKHLLELSSIRCQSGQWNQVIIGPILQPTNTNQWLDYGSNCESISRLELIFSALLLMIDNIDNDKINAVDLDHIFGGEPKEKLISRINLSLKERQFVGLQGWEKQFWDKHLRPLSFALIATLFLQTEHRKLDNSKILLDTLAFIAEKSYKDNDIAFYFRSILYVQDYTCYDHDYIGLAHSREDRFTTLLASYANTLHSFNNQIDIYYLGAAIDFVADIPSVYSNLTAQILQKLPDHLSTNTRHSKPKHWVDMFGFLASNKTQVVVSEMLKFGLTRKDVVNFHQQMITVKKAIAELLWCTDSSSIVKQLNANQNQKIAKCWLIIGDKNLEQCWMYRVEQKKDQLERLGCNVRCIDQDDLRDWSFSHQILWADAIIVCRLPAMYHVFRAMAFARNCGIKLYAEIDDLLFTPEYPAEYQSYGGTISLLQYKNLSIDYPLRFGILNYADEIIVSTLSLAEHYQQISLDRSQRVNILPNLPLDSLHKISEIYQQDDGWDAKYKIQRIALTSGTLSHKQILKDTIFPALLDTLNQHLEASLTVIGHIDLPSEFQAYESRITVVPFTSYEDYLYHLSQCTIALVPLELHPTTDSKSAIKWMEASLCGVTSICSPVRAYTDVTTDREDVIIAESLDEWRNGLNSLLSNPELRVSIGKNAFLKANNLFNEQVAINFWSEKINTTNQINTPNPPKKKVLVINVFFAPQSMGGATRVAQNYVQDMLNNSEINYDVTVLCIDYDNWQTNPPFVNKKKEVPKSENNTKNDLKKEIELKLKLPEQTLTDIEDLTKESDALIGSDMEEICYRDAIYVDESHWKGARVIRLNIPTKPWHIHEDIAIDSFCEEFFENESFDLIQCHCCQILTASPLIVARRMSIPYEIILHDAWWLSYEQFLVSPAGRVINPADPFAHFDHQPSEEEKKLALSRRRILYGILEDAERRIAVSSAFKDVCEAAGVRNVCIQENRVTPMKLNQIDAKIREVNPSSNYNLCHIGGMSLHKGYQLLRGAVHALPQNLPIQFTVVDHRLASPTENYNSLWNGYPVDFVAPIPMDEMPIFYANQDVLIAPSIWPESFGLVSREALSAGLWVIASDSGALADPLLTSVKPVGTVIRPNHLQDLIDAIEALPAQLNKYDRGGI